MPFETSDQGEYLYARFFGVLTPDELVTLAAEIERLEDLASESKHQIADLTALDEVEIAFPDVLLFANRRLSRTYTRPVKSAVIARKSVHIGFARMFQTLNDHPQLQVRIVSSMEEALRWLREA